MKRILLFLMAAALSVGNLSARKSGLHKFTSDAKDFLNIGVGPNYMFADLGGADFQNMWFTDWDLEYTRPSAFVGYEHAFNNYVGTRAQLVYNMFGGNDDNSRNEYRGFEYKSNSVELSIQALYYFFRGSWGRTTYELFLYAGIGYNWYWTKWSCNLDTDGDGVGDTYAQNRRPIQGALHLDKEIPNQDAVEGPDDDGMFKYSSGAWEIPFGIGIRFPVTPRLNLGADLSWRYAFGRYSDYMDGISTWWSNMNDTYATLMFTLSYRLQGNQDCYAKYGRGQFRHFNHGRR